MCGPALLVFTDAPPHPPPPVADTAPWRLCPIQGSEGRGHRLPSHQPPPSQTHLFPGTWLLSKKPSQKGTICQRDSDKPDRGVRRQPVDNPPEGEHWSSARATLGHGQPTKSWLTQLFTVQRRVHSPERRDSNLMHTPAFMSQVQ